MKGKTENDPLEKTKQKKKALKFNGGDLLTDGLTEGLTDDISDRRIDQSTDGLMIESAR